MNDEMTCCDSTGLRGLQQATQRKPAGGDFAVIPVGLAMACQEVGFLQANLQMKYRHTNHEAQQREATGEGQEQTELCNLDRQKHRVAAPGKGPSGKEWQLIVNHQTGTPGFTHPEMQGNDGGEANDQEAEASVDQPWNHQEAASQQVGIERWPERTAKHRQGDGGTKDDEGLGEPPMPAAPRAVGNRGMAQLVTPQRQASDVEECDTRKEQRQEPARHL